MRHLIPTGVNHRTGLLIFPIVGIVAAIFLMGGCVGPPALHDAVIGYDKVTNKLEQELMLLNIARAHHISTLHFTVTGSIAATFDFRTTAGLNRRWVINSRGSDFYDLNLGASASENPTFSIVPIGGEEFTERIVTPMEEGVYSILVFQGTKFPIVTRIMAAGFDMKDRNGIFLRFIANDPQRPEQYREFRRLTMHLAGLWNTQKLHVTNLLFDEVVIDGLKVQPKGEDLWKGEGLQWWLNPDGTWKVTRRKIGRVLISNYDSFSLTHSERYQLNELAKNNANNYVMVDIRPGYPGGDYPFFGTIKLRSFLGIISFVGQGIERAAEFDVVKDPRTPEPIGDNPRQTLAIEISDQSPPKGVTKINYRGQFYTIANNSWDREAFNILRILFQATVTDVSKVGIPITISK